MQVDNIVENDDGSADIDLHLEPGEARLLVQEGFIRILETYIKQEQVRKRLPALLQKKEESDNE